MDEITTCYLYDTASELNNPLPAARNNAWAAPLIQAAENRISNPARRAMAIFSSLMRQEILSHHLNMAPESITFHTGPNGKPAIKPSEDQGVHFNISHSGPFWTMAVSFQSAIGIDLECHKNRRRIPAILQHYFHPSEHRAYLAKESGEKQQNFFYRLWTQKEAYAKYLGEGLHYDFSLESFIEKYPEDTNIHTIQLDTQKKLDNEKRMSLSLASCAQSNLSALEWRGNVV